MNITLAFESKHPHSTPWLSVEFDEETEPTEFLARLKAAGWEEDTRFNRLPPLDGRQEIHLLGPKGSDLFGLWTEEEMWDNMQAITSVLEAEGFLDVPWHKLTLEEML